MSAYPSDQEKIARAGAVFKNCRTGLRCAHCPVIHELSEALKLRSHELRQARERLMALEEIRQRVADGWRPGLWRPGTVLVGPVWVKEGQVSEEMSLKLASLLWPENTGS